MTKEKEILRREYERLIGRLEEIDPVVNPETYKTVLEAIDHLAFLSKEHDIPVGIMASEDMPVCPEPETEPITEPEEDPDEPDNEPEEDTPAVTYKKEDVRAALAKARKSGTNVTELLGELGYDNFSAVPAGKYGEIMARIES